MNTFADGFLWGASIAPHQIEGNGLVPAALTHLAGAIADGVDLRAPEASI